MADQATPVMDSTAAFLAGLAAEQDAADDAANAADAAAKARFDTAWRVGYETWTIAGPPPEPAVPQTPVAPEKLP